MLIQILELSSKMSKQSFKLWKCTSISALVLWHRSRNWTTKHFSIMDTKRSSILDYATMIWPNLPKLSYFFKTNSDYGLYTTMLRMKKMLAKVAQWQPNRNWRPPCLLELQESHRFELYPSYNQILKSMQQLCWPA